jgi:hypothetical protein
MVCHQCREEVEVEGKVMRKDACPSCGSSLRCCRNCEFYDRSAPNQCREPAAEWVSNKEAANFCEFFEPGEGGGTDPSRGGDGRDAFERLFRK